MLECLTSLLLFFVAFAQQLGNKQLALNILEPVVGCASHCRGKQGKSKCFSPPGEYHIYVQVTDLNFSEHLV